MWTPEDGARYLRNNLDVLRAYEKDSFGMLAYVYAQRHWERFGQYEGRKSGPELDVHRKQPGTVDYPDDYFTPEAIAKRRAEEDEKAKAILAKPYAERSKYERDWLKNYNIKRDPLRGRKLVAPSAIAARYRKANPYLPLAWSKLTTWQRLPYGLSEITFILANRDMKEGEEPLPKLTADELKALQVKYTLEM